MIPDAKLDHVAIAVRDIATAKKVYVDVFGGRFLFGGDNEKQGFRFAQFVLPEGGKIEFVTPLRADGFVARFIESRGEGVHHITLKTNDIHRAIEEAEKGGLSVVMASTDGEAWKEAFVHPREAHGVLVQLAQSSWTDEEMARHHLDDHSGADHRHLTEEDLSFGR